MFNRFRRWLRGEFRCRRCGRVWQSHGSFGFGEMICPECYDGEREWLWPDMSYWLNRLLYGRSRVSHGELLAKNME